ncbi:MerR family transcriptional regulator [Paenibacillus dauci]|uniref:MerR family transcriptional regulator n=1 Tax=Paenibacillus dauci TaxID=1567106 RepID=UPI001E35BCAE|nr:MerR family transcriptional regulator [Paenibacillus dauci]
MNYVVENINISAKTLRFYEEQGILRNISRDEKGRRIYTQQNMDWIAFIRCLRETGMSIAKIKEYQRLFEAGNATFVERQEMLKLHKLEIQKHIEEELKHLEEINYKLAMYDLQKDEIEKNPNHVFKCHGMGSSALN